ncbi:3-demethylubiquinone-9 3-methyltransferase [Magnetospirillum fulvum]|uniref:Ubiquinone biosynthesis O-methyltransferase n=2 Tax=Magnetospirillum fulvum TaxID=1082 RepID=A0A1H6HKL4_MAGFU|nr:bifunctional 2-polyprenyl-6-hydroxyphenol methylase/3-demethylubiquinol 3-O-methyltransferase UbiG [Magnetospirillum fulvum]SEH35662.1 3-demethylubiquinone-9 3-methyltransferase [Magnetospirillum fulvum]
MTQPGTASPEEIARFTAMADAWWDPTGKFKPLHKFNPVRIDFMRRHFAEAFGRDPSLDRPFEGLTLLDVGSGGGLLSEPMAALGFTVTGIDAGEKNVKIASLHAEKTGANVTYRVASPEQLDPAEMFDVVLCMEVVEHVTDVNLFLHAAAAHLKPGGVFVGATMNRTPKAWLLAVVGAEYVLRWLPRGTHDWHKFVRPSEFSRILCSAGIEVARFVGVAYNPISDEWRETDSLDVNYLVVGGKPA